MQQYTKFPCRYTPVSRLFYTTFLLSENYCFIIVSGFLNDSGRSITVGEYSSFMFVLPGECREIRYFRCSGFTCIILQIFPPPPIKNSHPLCWIDVFRYISFYIDIIFLIFYSFRFVLFFWIRFCYFSFSELVFSAYFSIAQLYLPFCPASCIKFILFSYKE